MNQSLIKLADHQIENVIQRVRGERVMLDRLIRGLDKSAQSSRTPQSASLPKGLHISVNSQRGAINSFKVTICDLEARAELEIQTLCLRRTWHPDAFKCPEERTGSTSKHRNHACLRALARNDDIEC